MSNTSIVEATTRKTLVAQTSEQLYKKLQDGKLFGISKRIAVEILGARKEKGKFEGDLKVFTNGHAEKVEKKEKEVKVVKEPKEKKGKALKISQKFPDFKLKFVKGDEVEFTPYRSDKKLKGVVVSSHPWKPKSMDVYENVIVRHGEKTYLKKAELLTRVK